MMLLQDIRKSPPSPCHYLPGKTWRFDYFFAAGLNEEELDAYLTRGWRKFGYYFFRPACPDCRACIPLRVPTETYRISRSQKRVLAGSRDIRVRFGPLAFSDRIFDIYRDHSLHRFGKRDNDPGEFFRSFFTPSCPSLQSEYYLGDTLAGVGFLDRCRSGLSSVYFIYDTAFSRLNLGTFSVIREIGEAKALGLPYYYLGYYVEACPRMTYKNRFQPNETYNWDTGLWTGEHGHC
ncbi:arginyltransferase [Desulfatiferula olefinivorans]